MAQRGPNGQFLSRNQAQNGNFEEEEIHYEMQAPEELNDDTHTSVHQTIMAMMPDIISAVRQTITTTENENREAVPPMPTRNLQREKMIDSIRDLIPAIFEKSTPAQLQDFFKKITNYFDLVQGSLSEGDKVMFGRTKLISELGLWFDNHQTKHSVGSSQFVETWEQFKQLLQSKFNLKSDAQTNINNFNNIRQGQMPIVELVEKFQLLLNNDPDMPFKYVQYFFLAAINPTIKSQINTNDENLKNWDTLRKAAIRLGGDINTRTNYNYKSSQPQASANYVQQGKRQESTLPKKKKPFNARQKDYSNVTCRNCNQKGHFDRYCPLVDAAMQEMRKKFSTKQEANKAIIQNCMVDFTIDSGCTQHMVPEEIKLNTAIKYEIMISTAGSEVLKTTNLGTLNCIINNVNFTLQNVLQVPGLSKPLLSVAAFRAQNVAVIFDEAGDVLLTRQGEVLAMGTLNNNVYSIVLETFNGNFNSSQALSAGQNSLDIWHERLGHPGRNKLHTLCKLGCVGLPKADTSNNDGIELDCSHCLRGKLSRGPFKRSKTRASHPLQLIHSDVWGPARVLGLTGEKYFLAITDDYSRYTWVGLMADKKSETVSKLFQRYKAWAETQTGRRIMRMRTDNGGEYSEVIRLLQEYGIEHQHSVPYTP